MSNHEPLIMSYGDTHPDVDATAYIAPTAVLIGETTIHANASVFFNCVLRGDINRIEIGEGTNIQDLTMVHVDDGYPCIVGRNVVVGHSVVLHGCVVGDSCLIGMGAVLLNGVVLGAGCLVAAGSVVLEGTQIPPRSLVAGIPGKVRREVASEDVAQFEHLAFKYRKIARAFTTGHGYRPNLDLDIELD